MSVGYRTNSFVKGTTSATPAEPSGTLPSDVLLALVVSSTSTLTAPTGWQTILSGASLNSHFFFSLNTILRGASAPSYAWTAAGATYTEAHVFCFTGADPTVFAFVNAHSSNGTGPNPPAYKAVRGVNGMGVAGGIHWAGSVATWGQPGGYTRRSDNTTGNDIVVTTRDALMELNVTDTPGGITQAAGTDDVWSFSLVMSPLMSSFGGDRKPALRPRPFKPGNPR